MDGEISHLNNNDIKVLYTWKNVLDRNSIPSTVSTYFHLTAQLSFIHVY